MKNIIYGYARVSTPKQKLKRQTDNINNAYPAAVIVTEEYTGTRIDRPAFTKLLEQIAKERKRGNAVTLVFDEVSRMSRNAEEGFSLYQKLYSEGVELVFLKEPHINSAVYRDRAKKQIDAMTATTGSAATDKFIQAVIEALNVYAMDLVQEQIKLAFIQAEKEVQYLRKRTKEGIQKAREEGKQIGRAGAAIEGVDFTEYEKATKAKSIILKHSKDFGGTLSDAEVIKLAGCCRNSFYKYKRELKEQTA